jgi:hypothetical protein
MSDWFAAMRRADFAAAWEVSDAFLARRVPRWDIPRHEQSIWDGTPLTDKRVFVRCYHGLGDTIQFARFLPMVKRVARDVVAWVQPSLIPLLQTMRDPVRMLPLHDGTPDVEFDVDVEIMELAYVFRTTLDTLPNEVPYLHVEPFGDDAGRSGRRSTGDAGGAAPASGAGRFAHKLRIGVVWQAGDWDPNRSVPFKVDMPSNVEVISLQKGSDPRVDDPLSAARFMRTLNLVVTVDTMIAHLAGALGIRTFTLLPYEADWRWMNDRDDSPWYPTMRLFRQRAPGEWGDVLERVRYAVATMADETNDTANETKKLNEWGIDLDKFKERAKESLGHAKDDLTEIAGTLRSALVQAKEVVIGMQTAGSPAASELKGGFERAWKEIENAFKAAREKAKAASDDKPVDPTDPTV